MARAIAASRAPKELAGSRGSSAEFVSVQDLMVSLMVLSEQLSDDIAVELRNKGVLDIRPAWAITLFRMGDKAWRGVDLSEICLGFCSVSYPIKKMVGSGFLSVERNTTDGRSIAISRTKKGASIAKIVEDVLELRGYSFLINFSNANIAQHNSQATERIKEQLFAMSERMLTRM